MANSKDVPITLHFLGIGPNVRGSFVTRLSDTDVELYDIGVVDVEPIKVTHPIFVPSDDSEWMVSMLMRRQNEQSYFVAAIGSGTFDGGTFHGGTFD